MPGGRKADGNSASCYPKHLGETDLTIAERKHELVVLLPSQCKTKNPCEGNTG